MATPLAASAVLRRVIQTDRCITLRQVEHHAPPIYDELRRLLDLSDTLWPCSYSLFVSGSQALALRAAHEGQLLPAADIADVDLWLIVAAEPLAGLRSHDPIWQRVAYLADYDMVALPWLSRLNVSIKLLRHFTARAAFSLTNQSLHVLRTTSLRRRKPVDRFWGLTGQFEHKTVERQVENGYVWEWESIAIRPNDLVMTDLLSFAVIGGFLVDHCSLSNVRATLLSNLYSEVVRREENPSLSSGLLFEYLRKKHPAAFSVLLSPPS